jgi:hypothetical protein
MTAFTEPWPHCLVYVLRKAFIKPRRRIHLTYNCALCREIILPQHVVEQEHRTELENVYACCSFHSSAVQFLATGLLTAKSLCVKSRRGADAAAHKCSGTEY